MMDKKVIASLLAAASLLAVVSSVSAQVLQDNGSTLQDTNVSAPSNSVQGNQGVVGGTNNSNNDSGFNWLWLLPLLAVPILYFITYGSEDEDRDYRRGGQFAGVKGGRARKRDRDKDVDDSEEDTGEVF